MAVFNLFKDLFSKLSALFAAKKILSLDSIGRLTQARAH